MKCQGNCQYVLLQVQICMRKKTFKIKIHVAPLVKRWLDNNFKIRNNAYDISLSSFYFMFSGALQQSHFNAPSILSRKYAGFVEVFIYITEFDFYHYGWEISPLQEVRLSKCCTRLLLDDICNRAMVLHCYLKHPLAKTLLELYNQQFIEESELRFVTLQKYYHRHFRHREQQLLENLRYLDNPPDDSS